VATTQQQKIIAQQLEALAELGGKTFHPKEMIVFEGEKLILPVGSTIGGVRDMLDAYEAELAATVNYSRTYKFRPWDVAYNGVKALEEHFGLVSHRGSFLSPPALIDVPVGVDEVVQVPWGRFQIIQLPKVVFSFGSTYDEELGTLGTIGAKGPKEDAFHIQGVFNLIEEYIQFNSIYKGKAIDGQDMPNFIEVDNLDEATIVYSKEVKADLDANLFEPLARRGLTASQGLPLKRSILLQGPFGTGKTLALKLGGKIATNAAEPWTFLLVRPGRDSIEEAMKTARLLAPTLIAFEDVDTVANAKLEADRISKMLDLFDGLDAKGQDVMAVLTTNHVEAIQAGMLRPGRLDAIIEVGAPDAAGIRKLIEVNLPAGRLADEINWDEIGQAFEGYLPAFVVEAAHRSVRYQLRRIASEVEADANLIALDADTEEYQETFDSLVLDRLQDAKLDTEDLVYAAHGLRAQWKLMNGAKTGHEEPQLDRAVRHLVGLAIEGKLDSRLLNEED
jgi:transitional endoplasmic reticulum ATPase